MALSTICTPCVSAIMTLNGSPRSVNSRLRYWIEAGARRRAARRTSVATTTSYGPAVAQHAAEAIRHPLSNAVSEKGRLHLLDTLAAIVSGAGLEAGVAGQRYAAGLRGAEMATILG